MDADAEALHLCWRGQRMVRNDDMPEEPDNQQEELTRPEEEIMVDAKTVLSVGKVTKTVYGPGYTEFTVRITSTPGLREGIRQHDAVAIMPLRAATDLEALVDIAIAANEADFQMLQEEESDIREGTCH